MRALGPLVERLGIPGVLAIGVLLFSALFYYSGVRPLEHELEMQQAAGERLRSRTPAQLVSSDDRTGDLRRFHELFPPVERLPEELEHFYAVARAAGLQMQQAEYRLEARSGGLLAYRVNFPVRGSYSQIRQFVGATLQEMSTVSLDALRFERKRVGETQLDAQVRLTIHFRPEGDDGYRPPAPSEDTR